MAIQLTIDQGYYPQYHWRTTLFLKACEELFWVRSKPLGNVFPRFFYNLKDLKISELSKMNRLVKFFDMERIEIPETITVNGVPLNQIYQEAVSEIKFIHLIDPSQEPEKTEEQETALQTQAMISDKLNFMAKRMEEQYNLIVDLIKTRQV